MGKGILTANYANYAKRRMKGEVLTRRENYTAKMILGFGIAVWEGHETIRTDQHVEQIDPTNLPVMSVNAFVEIRVKGSVFPDLTQWNSIPLSTNWGSKKATATLSASGPAGPFSSAIPTMISDDFGGIGTGNPDSREYFLSFHMESVSAAMTLPYQPASKTFSAANFISIDAKFLPPQSEILDGYAFVVVNNALCKLFHIYPQTNLQPPFPTRENAEILSKIPFNPKMYVVMSNSQGAVVTQKISMLEPGKVTSGMVTSTNNSVEFPIEATFFGAEFTIVGTNVPGGKFSESW